MTRQNLGTRDGFTLTLRTEHDQDATPWEADCYTAEDRAAWRNDEWEYVTVIVEAERGGVILGTGAVGAVEHGMRLDDGSYTDANDITNGSTSYYLPDLTAEAIANARATVKLITEASK